MIKNKVITFLHTPEIFYEQNYGTRFAPVWAYTLASYLEPSWTPKIVDLSVDQIESVVESQVFAFSGINQDLKAIGRAHAHLKKQYPNSIFILGGPITWSFEQNGNLGELQFFDHLFILDGEETLKIFLQNLETGKPNPKIIRASRFDLTNAKPLYFKMFKDQAKRYYGSVLEVSRGCPFLCEFCDIRVLPQNNESHTKDVNLIVEELAEYYKLGIRQIQLACDNFIGDLRWAEQCVDAILAWTEKTGSKFALHTWATVNLSGHPELMKKMRLAGFTSIFIGVESFNSSSILETSKVQNKNNKDQMVDALKIIHSYGFVIAPGLIFGFDSDGPEMFESMLDGVRRSGLIGGDPTFLLALPGTPLYKRMKLTKRLVGYDKTEKTLSLHKERVSKVESNIEYLQPKNFLIEGFLDFIRQFTSGSFAYEKFKRHVEIMTGESKLISTHSVGYGNLGKYLMFQLSSFHNFKMFFIRIYQLLKPQNFFAMTKAYLLVLRHKKTYSGLKNHFYFWLFTWSNLLVKYRDLKAADFKIHSIDENYDMNALWKYIDYQDTTLVGGRNELGVKVALQYKATQEALKVLKEKYGNTNAPEFSKFGLKNKKRAA